MIKFFRAYPLQGFIITVILLCGLTAWLNKFLDWGLLDGIGLFLFALCCIVIISGFIVSSINWMKKG